MWRNYLYFCICTMVMHMACADIVIKVEKKNKEALGRNSADAAARSRVPVSQSIQPREIEYYLHNLDHLRNTSAESLINDLEQNWRLIFRREFRVLRDDLVSLAKRKHSYQEGIYFNLEADCSELKLGDLAPERALDSLPMILEGSFLAFLNKADAMKVNVDLEKAIDLSSHLILFELGMQAKGSTQVEHRDGMKIYKSQIRWKVNSEIQDSEEVRQRDKLSVTVEFSRATKNGKPYGFDMKFYIGEGQFEGVPVGPQYRLEVNNEWNYSDLKGVYLKSVFQIFHNQDIHYSRAIELEQTTVLSQSFLIKESIRYGLPDEASRSAFLDFTQAEKCAAEKTKFTLPSVIGMTQKQANQALGIFGFPVKVVEDLSEGDAEALIVKQSPKPGSVQPYGTEVQVVLGDISTDLGIDPVGENLEQTTPPLQEEPDATIEVEPVLESEESPSLLPPQ